MLLIETLKSFGEDHKNSEVWCSGLGTYPYQRIRETALQCLVLCYLLF